MNGSRAAATGSTRSNTTATGFVLSASATGCGCSARAATTGRAGIPWVVETARKIRQTQFVIDGEAEFLGVDGISDFNGLHSLAHQDRPPH